MTSLRGADHADRYHAGDAGGLGQAGGRHRVLDLAGAEEEGVEARRAAPADPLHRGVEGGVPVEGVRQADRRCRGALGRGVARIALPGPRGGGGQTDGEVVGRRRPLVPLEIDRDRCLRRQREAHRGLSGHPLVAAVAVGVGEGAAPVQLGLVAGGVDPLDPRGEGLTDALVGRARSALTVPSGRVVEAEGHVHDLHTLRDQPGHRLGQVDGVVDADADDVHVRRHVVDDLRGCGAVVGVLEAVVAEIEIVGRVERHRAHVATGRGGVPLAEAGVDDRQAGPATGQLGRPPRGYPDGVGALSAVGAGAGRR